jgi:hypothetical protein
MPSSRARRWGRWAAVALVSSLLPACGGGGGGGGGGPVSLGTPTHVAATIVDIGGAGTTTPR